MVLPATTALRPLFPLVLLTSAFLFEDWASTPTCTIVPANPNYAAKEEEEEPMEGLKVMMVANLLLLPPGGGGPLKSTFLLYLNYFRDFYLSKFFQRSFDSLRPDMLLVLGDLTAGGVGGSDLGWVPVLRKFDRVIGPFFALPHHVVLGDRETGDCDSLDVKSVYRVSRVFPGLDPSGCGSFEIGNVSFVSLNAVALLCEENALRYGVEKAVEMESSGLRMMERGNGDGVVGAGSGPVVLVHFPLHRMGNESCGGGRGVLERDGYNFFRWVLSKLDSRLRGFLGDGLYDLSQTVPRNASGYIFQALKPRIIFSAHAHEFCDHTHTDGTREVTIPAMSWKVKDDPGFILATFHGDGNALRCRECIFECNGEHIKMTKPT